MAATTRERRLKMKARRRSPVMLAMGVVTALAAAPGAVAAAAAAASGPGRTERAARDEVGGPPSARDAAGPCAERLGPPAPPARLEMIWQAGWHHGWTSSDLGAPRSASIFSVDLGMTVRGDDGHRWGGAVEGFWYGGHRSNVALKGVRRWTLEEASGSYVQLSPGLLAGTDDRVDLDPGFLLEAELGNPYVALCTGLHVQGWRARPSGPEFPERGVQTTWTLGGRVHGGIGAGIVVGAYLALALLFATSGGGGWS